MQIRLKLAIINIKNILDIINKTKSASTKLYYETLLGILEAKVDHVVSNLEVWLWTWREKEVEIDQQNNSQASLFKKTYSLH